MKKLLIILIIFTGLFYSELSKAQVHPNGITIKKHIKLYDCYIVIDNDTLDMLVDSAKVAEMIAILGGDADSAEWADTAGYSLISENLDLPNPSDTVIIIMYPDGHIDTAGYELVPFDLLYTTDTRDSLITAYDSVHTHPNKSLLNAITQGDIDKLDRIDGDTIHFPDGGKIYEGASDYLFLESDNVIIQMLDHLLLKGLGLNSETVTSTSYTTGWADNVIICDASSNAITINLTNISDQVLTIKKTDSSGNAITIDPAASNQIEGSSTYTLSTQYDFIRIICISGTWFIIGKN